MAVADIETPSLIQSAETKSLCESGTINRLRVVAVLALILALYAVLAVSVSAAKAPWMDEGWISIPGWNLAFHGHTGNPFMEPTGFWVGDNLKGIHEIDYLNMPLYTPIEAVWFRLFGFSVLTMRSLSIALGGIAILAWFFIVESFAGVRTALLTAGLLASDFTYLGNATDGRMDMMCMCFWAVGIALYLQLRQRSLKQAILGANLFVAASLFTHPNGIVGFVLLGSLVVLFDRTRLKTGYLAQGWPYAAGMAGWLGYISIKPAWFVAQFGANSSPKAGRLDLLPWDSIWREVVLRYLTYFAGDTPWGHPTPPYALFVMLSYWIAFLVIIIGAVRRKDPVIRYAAVIAGIPIIALTFLVGFKPPNYLIHVIPGYALCIAICAINLPSRRRELAVALLGVLITFQALTIRAHIGQSDASDYKLTVNFIRNHIDSKARLIAGSYFFFDLPDYNLSDDLKLGYRTHVDPDYIVVDRWDSLVRNNILINQPGAWLHIQKMLSAANSHPIFKQGEYTIYSVN